MKLIQRASRLLEANVNHLLDLAELRRETVNALAREKQLDKKIQAACARAEELVKQAVLALENKDQELARRILGERVETLKSRESLAEEQRRAHELARRLKTALNRMEAKRLEQLHAS